MATIELESEYRNVSTTTGPVVRVRREYDFKANHVAAADVVELIDVPEGMHIQQVYCQCVRAEGGTLTLDIGIATDNPDGFFDGFNANSAGGAMLASGAWAAQTTGGFITREDETIDMVVNNAADNAKIVVTALMVPVGVV